MTRGFGEDRIENTADISHLFDFKIDLLHTRLGLIDSDFFSDFLLLCTIYNTYNINSIEEITSLKERKNITNTSPK